jgi:hypothetical protein
MPPTARKKMGRPREFKRRTQLGVLLEAHELRALRARARTEGVSASRLARRLLQIGLGLSTETRP